MLVGQQELITDETAILAGRSLQYSNRPYQKHCSSNFEAKSRIDGSWLTLDSYNEPIPKKLPANIETLHFRCSVRSARRHRCLVDFVAVGLEQLFSELTLFRFVDSSRRYLGILGKLFSTSDIAYSEVLLRHIFVGQ